MMVDAIQLALHFDFAKAIKIQLPRKRQKISMLEVSGKDLCSQGLDIFDHNIFAVRIPKSIQVREDEGSSSCPLPEKLEEAKHVPSRH